MGHFLCLGSPAQGPPLAPSASPLPPCTQAVYATVLGSVWNPVYEQSNRRFLFFLPFHLLLPQSKAAAASHGLVLRQWWQPGCSCSQPQGAEFQLLARDPPSDLLTACLQFSPSPHLSGLSAPLLSQLSHSGVLAGRMEPSWVSSGGCNSRLSAETALQGPLCLTSVPTEASRAFGPLLGDSSCGGLRNRRLWKPPIRCTP